MARSDYEGIFSANNPIKYSDITPELITNLYLYGTKSTPPDLIDRIWTEGSEAITLYADAASYMKDGPGRYTNPSQFNAIEEFFSEPWVGSNFDVAEGEKKEYSKEDLMRILSLEEEDFRSGGVQQYDYGEGSWDYDSRVYIFNSTSSVIDSSRTDLKFIVENINGELIKNVENIRILPFNDNFDFESDDILTTVGNYFLKNSIDPQDIGKTVSIEFTENSKKNSPVIASYTSEDFESDEDISYSGTIISAKSATNRVVTNLTNKKVIEYTRDGKSIVYGSENDDDLSRSDANDNIYVMGDGDDRAEGDIYDDIFIGGKGDDYLDGGLFLFGLLEKDISVYRGNLSEYEFEFLSDDTIKIKDTVTNRDGTDTLKGVEVAQFADKTVDLSPGQDIAFVIDTTSSMSDDIGSVKTRAKEIIELIYSPERGFIDSRIAVVGYNDPSTETILSFTNHEKIEDRKSAAIDAINGISVYGGGDIPEMVYSGLLKALSGEAGEWQEEAGARRIILFGDAPPKDTELKEKVEELAKNLNTSIDDELSVLQRNETIDDSKGIIKTTLEVSALKTSGETITSSVEIFTILVGSNSEAKEAFTTIAETSGGSTFTATDATEIVDVLLEVIESETPPTTSSEVVTNPVESDSNRINYFLLEIDKPISNDASVEYQTRDGSAVAGQDYVFTSGTATIEAGKTSIVIPVEIIGDDIDEADETFSLVITNPQEGIFPENSTEIVATHTIIDDDSPETALRLIGSSTYESDTYLFA